MSDIKRAILIVAIVLAGALTHQYLQAKAERGKADQNAAIEAKYRNLVLQVGADEAMKQCVKELLNPVYCGKFGR